jgi:hypothetical protein
MPGDIVLSVNEKRVQNIYLEMCPATPPTPISGAEPAIGASKCP